MKRNQLKKSGFGLIEVVISLGIIALVMGSVTLLGRVVYNGTIVAKHRAEASAFAQQGTELVRQIRDTQLVDKKTGTWDNWFDSGGFGDNVSLTNANSSKNWRLVTYGSSGSQYTMTSQGVDYTRNIIVYKDKVPTDLVIDNPNTSINENIDEGAVYRKVVSTVTWQDYGRTQTVELITYLTNWKTV